MGERGGEVAMVGVCVVLCLFVAVWCWPTVEEGSVVGGQYYAMDCDSAIFGVCCRQGLLLLSFNGCINGRQQTLCFLHGRKVEGAQG